MLSNKEAQSLIDKKVIEIDGVVISENCIISDASEIKVNGIIKRAKKEFVYLRFYKPVGFQSTLNKNVDNNLASFFKGYEGLAIAGRLDKQSEGLLLLSNNGKWVEELCNPKFEKEKEYIVVVDKQITDEFVNNFKNGIEIDKYITKKCFCEKMNENSLRIILTEGKNRQIRKMCQVLGYSVLNLKRIRVADLLLADIQAGKFEFTII
jgi:23S rRNA pseudouridine2604 synthase